MDFIGSDGDAGAGLGFSSGHDHPKEPALVIKNGATAVAMVQVKVQDEEIIGLGRLALKNALNMA